jgi:pyrroline-5-carboxylate reductase
VTAVSGSGPAYVFLLIESLAKAAVAAGLAPDLATRLARATVAGAGELARLSDESAAQLRENVTSPGGTTQAALEVLMGKDGLEPLLTRAVLAAARRARELAE